MSGGTLAIGRCVSTFYLSKFFTSSGINLCPGSRIAFPTTLCHCVDAGYAQIGTAWDIPVGDTQEVISLLDRELDAIRAAGEGGTVAHVLPGDELPMHATGLETLDNIWGLFETSLRMDSMQARTKMFEMAKWLEESQNLLD